MVEEIRGEKKNYREDIEEEGGGRIREMSYGVRALSWSS